MVRHSSNRGFQGNFNTKFSAKKKMNPVWTDVRRCCGAFRHLIANCPDTLANQGNVNVTEYEHAILFTGYNNNNNCIYFQRIIQANLPRGPLLLTLYTPINGDKFICFVQQQQQKIL